MKKKKTDRTGCITILIIAIMIIAFWTTVIEVAVSNMKAACIIYGLYTIGGLILVGKLIDEEKILKKIAYSVIFFGLIELMPLILWALISVIQVIC